MTTDLRYRIAKTIAVQLINGGTVSDAADALIAALPGMVKPLEWDELGDKWGTVTCGRVQITRRGCDPYWDLSCSSAGSDGYFNSLEAAKAAADAHHVAQIMAAFGIAAAGREGE